MRWVIFTWVCLLCLPVPARAGEPLERARHLFEFMKFGQSLEIAEKVLRSPVQDPRKLVEAYKLKGLCLSALGQREKALEVFQRLLAVDPDARVSNQLSPKITDMFYRAVAMNEDSRPLSLWHSPPRVQSGRNLAGMELTVHLEADAFRLVHTVRLRYLPRRGEDRRLSQRVRGRDKLVFELPPDFDSTEVDYFFDALNRHGGVLLRLTDKGDPYHVGTTLMEPPDLEDVAGAAALVSEEDQPVQVQAGAPHRTWGHVSFWSGVGLLALGGVATWQAIDAADAYNASYGDDQAAGDRSRAWAGVMYTGYAAGAALITTGLVLWLTGPGPDETARSAGLHVAPTPGSGGLSVGVRGNW